MGFPAWERRFWFTERGSSEEHAASLPENEETAADSDRVSVNSGLILQAILPDYRNGSSGDSRRRAPTACAGCPERGFRSPHGVPLLPCRLRRPKARQSSL